MSSALIPELQFNALPYVSVAQYLAETGDVSITRGQVIHYFSPADTGIVDWPGNYGDPYIALAWCAFSKQMVCQGCSHYTFTLCTKMRERSHDLGMGITLLARAWVPAEPGVMVPPGIKIQPNAWAEMGSLNMGVSEPGHVDPILPPGDPGWPTWYKSCSCSWDVGDIAPGGTIQGGLTGQMEIRLYAPSGVGALLSGFNAFMYGSLLATT
jgi:hypothetical protein